MVIRDERPGDASAVRALYLDAFPTSQEADLVGELRSEPSYAGFVAESEGEIVGHFALTPVAVATPAGEGRGVGLAPLAVAPKHQNQGVGSALVRHAIDVSRARGEAFLVVLGDPEFYSRFGFRMGAPALRWRSETFDPYFLVYPIEGDLPPEFSGVVRYHPAIESLE